MTKPKKSTVKVANNKKNVNTKKGTVKKKVSIKAKTVSNKIKQKIIEKQMSKREKVVLSIIVFLLSILMIVSSYAWFSTSLKVRVQTFNMMVSRNGGLTISLDGINFGPYVELTEDSIIHNLTRAYPNHINQWSAAGMTPVSSNGISNPNNSKFDIYASGGIRYRGIDRDNGFFSTTLAKEDRPTTYNYYIAFDIFLKNVTGSPIYDNLYFDEGTEVKLTSESGEEMSGLFNSLRLGFVKVGSVPLTASINQIQNVSCNNSCVSTIFEPNSTSHSELSIERALKFGVNLVDGESYPTYGTIKGGGPIYVKNAVSGTENLDMTHFALQNTITEQNFSEPIFQLPDGITKVRMYLWIEGQDIDSLETDSQGAELSISINLIKDTEGYDSFN